MPNNFENLEEDLKTAIRGVPDFPKKGILFYDITTLLNQPQLLKLAADAMVAPFTEQKIDHVVGIESRGFIFSPMIAYQIGAGFIPVRKPNKLPAAKEKVTYELEYGTDTLEIHKDAIKPGDKVLIADDLLATGGTAKATKELIEKIGGEVVGITFLVELCFLKGREKLDNIPVYSLVRYDK